MGFGSFAGGLAKGFTSTYQMLKEQEERDLAMQERRDKIAREKALDKAFSETYGRVGQSDDYAVDIQMAGGNKGTNLQQAQQLSAQGQLPGNTAEDQAFERASAEAAAGAMRENAARKGAIPASDEAIPAMTPQEYTQKQATADYAKRAAGVSRQGAIEALQIKKAYRADKIDEDFDSLMDERKNNLQQAYSTFETGGMKGLTEAAKKAGLKVEYAETNGVGRINLLGPKGDVLETYASGQEALAKLEGAINQNFESKAVALLGGPREVLTYMNQRRELDMSQQRLGFEKQRVGIEQDRLKLAQDEAPGKIALTKAQTAQAQAQTRNAIAEAKGAELKGQDTAEYSDLRRRMLKILEKPTAENQAELRQLARRAAMLNPKEVLREVKLKQEDGSEKAVVVNIYTNEVSDTLKEAGVPSSQDWAAAKQGKKPDGTPLKPEEITRWNAAHSPEYQISTGKPARPSAIPAKPATSAAPSPAQRVAATGPQKYPAPAIPEPPPPKYIGGRGGQKLNPAYVEWEQRNQQR